MLAKGHVLSIPPVLCGTSRYCSLKNKKNPGAHTSLLLARVKLN